MTRKSNCLCKWRTRNCMVLLAYWIYGFIKLVNEKHKTEILYFIWSAKRYMKWTSLILLWKRTWKWTVEVPFFSFLFTKKVRINRPTFISLWLIRFGGCLFLSTRSWGILIIVGEGGHRFEILMCSHFSKYGLVLDFLILKVK